MWTVGNTLILDIHDFDLESTLVKFFQRAGTDNMITVSDSRMNEGLIMDSLFLLASQKLRSKALILACEQLEHHVVSGFKIIFSGFELVEFSRLLLLIVVVTIQGIRLKRNQR